ncbi:MAG: hypothetical protein AB8H79_00340 [Myxococcota bacterium]
MSARIDAHSAALVQRRQNGIDNVLSHNKITHLPDVADPDDE